MASTKILVFSFILFIDLTSATFLKDIKAMQSYAAPAPYYDGGYAAPPQTYAAPPQTYGADVKPPTSYVAPSTSYNNPSYPPKSGYNYNQPQTYQAPTYESRPVATYVESKPATYETKPATYESRPSYTSYQQSGSYGLPNYQPTYSASYLAPDKPGPWNLFSFFKLPKFGIFNKDMYPQHHTYTAYNSNPEPYYAKPAYNYQPTPSYQISNYPANNYYSSNQGVYQVPPPTYPIHPKNNYPTAQPSYNPNYPPTAAPYVKPQQYNPNYPVTTTPSSYVKPAPAPYVKPTPAPSNYAPPQSYSIYLVPQKSVYPSQSAGYNPAGYEQVQTSYRQQMQPPQPYNVAQRPYPLDGPAAAVYQDGYAKNYFNQYPYGAVPTPSVATYATTPKHDCKTTTPAPYYAEPTTVKPTTTSYYATEAYTTEATPQPTVGYSSGKPEARLLELFSDPNGTDGWRQVKAQ